MATPRMHLLSDYVQDRPDSIINIRRALENVTRSPNPTRRYVVVDRGTGEEFRALLCTVQCFHPTQGRQVLSATWTFKTYVNIIREKRSGLRGV